MTVQGLLVCEEVVLESLSAGREMVCPLKPCTSIFATEQGVTNILEALPGPDSCQHFKGKEGRM